MTTTVRGYTYTAKFSYDRREGTPQPWGVVCNIWRRSGSSDPGEIVATGFAMCNPSDNFSKIVGRKLALKRALSPGMHRPIFTTYERRAIWIAYLRTHRFTNGRGPLTPDEVSASFGQWLKKHPQGRAA